MSCEKININGNDYIRADLVFQPATPLDGKPFVIVRSYGAGVFAGYLRDQKDAPSGHTVILDKCIRLHQWTGCSLSQVANDGIAPSSAENRFSMETSGHEIMQVIEIIPATEKARVAIQSVKTWKK